MTDDTDLWDDYEQGDEIEQPVVGYVVVERTNDTGTRAAEIQAVTQAEHSPVTGVPENREPAWDGGWSRSIELGDDDRIVAAFPATETVTQVLTFVGNGFGHARFETDPDQEGDE